MAVDNELVASRVREALARSSLRQQELAARAGMDPTALSKALNGKRRFSSLELALVGESLGVSVSQLLRDEPQRETPSVGARGARVAARLQPESSPAVAAATGRLQELLDIEQTLDDAGFPAPPARLPLRKGGGRAPIGQGEWLAQQVRELGKDPDGPLHGLESWAESALHVDVAVEPCPPGVDGLCVARGDYRLVLINSATAATRQRWTLAHEIGHLAAGDGDDVKMVIDQDLYGRRNPAETRANAFAAALLMPRSLLCVEVGPDGPLHEPWVARMLIRFRVSPDAFAFRMHNLGLTNSTGRDRLRQLSARKLLLQTGAAAEYQRQQQARGARRVPSGMLSRALQAYAAGAISVRVLSHLTARPADELLEELASPEERVGAGREGVLLV